MKKLVALFVPLTIALALYASSGAVAAPRTMTLTATLSGRNEVGAMGAPGGRGTATITITMATKRLCYNLRVSGFKLPALAAHIHAGRAGVSGPIVVPFPTAPGMNGRASGCTRVRAALLRAIAAHPALYYVNVHTARYPGGAVRGQLRLMSM